MLADDPSWPNGSLWTCATRQAAAPSGALAPNLASIVPATACGDLAGSKNGTNVCYVSNHRAGSKFAGSVTLTAYDHFGDGTGAVVVERPVSLPAGPGALEWFTAAVNAKYPDCTSGPWSTILGFGVSRDLKNRTVSVRATKLIRDLVKRRAARNTA